MRELLMKRAGSSCVRARLVIGLFCLVIGLFCLVIGLFCLVIGLFCLVIGLFCLVIGLFCLVIGGRRVTQAGELCMFVYGEV